MERYRTPTVFHVSYQRLSVLHWKYRTNLFRANHFPFGLHAIKIAHYVAKVLDCFFLIFTCIYIYIYYDGQFIIKCVGLS